MTKLLTAVLIACLMSACAHMHIVCQDAGTTSLAVGGNTAGQQVLTLGLAVAGTAAKGAGFMALAPKAAEPKAQSAQAQSFVDYTYMPIFGSDFASCSALPPPTPPSTSVMVLSPNGGQPQIITTDSHQIVVAPPLAK